MRRVLLVGVLCGLLLLAGCQNWTSGSYEEVTPHREAYDTAAPAPLVHVSSYAELRAALQALVDSRAESGALGVTDYGQSLEADLSKATQYITKEYPLGAYAVQAVNIVLDQSGASRTANVEIQYRRTAAELQRVQPVRGIPAAEAAVTAALEDFSSSLVLQISGYTQTDFTATVAEYASAHPEAIMELPTLTVQVYPDQGSMRIVEITFTYTSTTSQMRQMLSRVEAVFAAAESYAYDAADEAMTASRLYSFLMARYDYTMGTSVTPSYSLLYQGVGDSKTFAEVFAAMCRQSGLECWVVSGTRGGAPWYWNILACGDGYYCHADLAGSLGQPDFQGRTDEEMTGYEWDREEYPACLPLPEPPEEVREAGNTNGPTDVPVQPEPPATEPPATEPPADPEPVTEPTQDPEAPTGPGENEENP